jgi:hypothetical protein
VLTLLCHGCPLQAIVAAFGFDERTVAQWQARAGEHCQEVHRPLVEQGQVELGQVQADELWVKLVLLLISNARKKCCGAIAMPIAWPSRGCGMSASMRYPITQVLERYPIRRAIPRFDRAARI